MDKEDKAGREMLNKCFAMIVNNVKGYNRQYGVEVCADHNSHAIPAEAGNPSPEDVAQLLSEAIKVFEMFLQVTPIYSGDDSGYMSVDYIDEDKQTLADYINSMGYVDKDGNKATPDTLETEEGEPVEWSLPQPKLTLVH